MIRHQAFFEFLAGSDQTSSAWQPVLAGLATLRFVDSRLDESGSEADWASVESVRTAVTSMKEGDPIRAILTSLVDAASETRPSRTKIGHALIAYGKALNFESRLALAANVFETADILSGAPANPDISIDANIRLGSAARRMLDWQRSENAYSRATHIAEAIGDKASMLLVDVRRATSHMIRGNLPEAEALITETVAKARATSSSNVIGLALHGRSSIAFQKGQYADAVRFGYEGLEHMGDSAERDALLSDIAAAFGGLGMNDAARDGYLIVSLTAQSQWTKCQATLNLMELAAMEGNEPEFDRIASQLEKMTLDLRQECVFHLFRGQGLSKFGKLAEGETQVSKAISIAETNQLHKLAHEATVALAELKSQTTSGSSVVQARSDIDPSLRWIVSELSSMRESVMSGA
jgi:hypothetical protein